MSRLLNLIHLDKEEKAKRGLIHTPGEIAQQPHTWATTFMNFQQRRPEIQAFLQSKGIGPDSRHRPIVFSDWCRYFRLYWSIPDRAAAPEMAMRSERNCQHRPAHEL